jgi:hypothetical protein
MTLVVRDEEDIVETNLRYHLEQGVDFVYAIDHNSTDGTPDILRSFERMGVLRMLREEGDVHDQAPRVTRLARMAHDELGADWVINNDADEFWWPALGDLKDVVCAIPPAFGVLVARRHDFIPRPEGGPFHERMVWRHAVSRTPTGGSLGPKVAHRGRPDIEVAPGNHDILGPPLVKAPLLPLVEVLHFPARTYEQFARKTLNTGRGYELLPGRGSGTGIDQLELLEMLRQGTLSEYYDDWALGDIDLERGVAAGSVVEDLRLRDFLRARRPASRSGDSKQVRDVVHGALHLAVDLAGALAHTTDLSCRNADLTRERAELVTSHAVEVGALAREQAHLAAHLAARDAELAEVHDALAQIRNSRLMRATHRLRRAYYRLK